jgi:reactive intermediate/imine deaminase
MKQTATMTRISTALFIGLFALAPLPGAEMRAVVPAGGPSPAGPYSPGIDAGDYIYVAGQGAESPAGKMRETFEGQVRQTLENIKAVVQAAGLTMDHVVYQVYLADAQNFHRMNRVYAEFFPTAPPARATLGVAKLAGTPVEINAVAVRDLGNKKVVTVPGYDPGEPVSAGILTHDRLFVSAMRGRDRASGTVPTDPAAQVELALDGVKAVVEAAGLGLGNMVFVNPYLTKQIPGRVMNKLYASRFEFGNAPARATIEVSSLPEGAQIEFTGVAVRDLSQRRALRPKNMRPSPTASPCVFAGDTLYCSAKDAFTPGPIEGIFADTVATQVRHSVRNLLDNLEEAEMDLGDVEATNVYLDDISDFQAMNKIYAQYFKAPYPARTTIQQIEAIGNRKANDEGSYPALEQISLVAIRGTRSAVRGGPSALK